MTNAVAVALPSHSAQRALRVMRPILQVTQAVSPDLAAALYEKLFFTPPTFRATERGRRWLATGRPFRVDVRGREIAGWSWGTGAPVYLVHGWGDSAASLHAIAAPFIAAGHRVVTFDAPGHGASGRRRSSLPEFVWALGAMAATQGAPDIVVAHSMGAAAAVLAAGDGSCVANRYVFLAPPSDPAEFVSAFARAGGLREATIQRMRQRVALRLGFRWEDLDVLTHARRLRAPLLVIHDRADETVAVEDGEKLARAWPNAEFVATDGLRHRGMLRDAAVISRVLEFATTQRPAHGVIARETAPE